MFALFTVLLLFQQAYAAEKASVSASAIVIAPEVVVTGKRLRGDHRSARVFTETDFARESGRSLGEVLRESAGVDFISGTGGNSNLLIRGSSGSQTLVIIDGVKVNDPSATNRYFDWSRIDVSEVERVEILKGPQAVSYGSDAIGGVVLITTKYAGGGLGFTTNGSLEAGSGSFVRARGVLGTALGDALGGDHHLNVQALGKGVFEGSSSALGPNGISLEGDDSKEASLGLALNSRWGRDTRTSIAANLRAAEEEIDGGAFDDDPNSVARNREIRASAKIDGKDEKGTEWGALASHLDFRRAYSDFPDARHTSTSDSILSGTNTRAEFHLRSESEANFEWTLGLEGTRETLRIDSLLFPTRLSRDHDETYALFVETALPLTSSRSLSLDLGSRFSRFESYGTQWSGKAGLSARPNTSLELDVGVSTGFKAPSLYSLYDPTYGNPSLKPEESVQAEAGLSLKSSARFSSSFRGFTSRITNRFGYDSTTFRSLNIERAEVSGLELESDVGVARGVRVIPSVTYLSTKDLQTGRGLPGVPQWKGTLKGAFDFNRAHSATLSLIGKTSRPTSTANASAAGFYRVDLTSRHRLSDALTFTSRFENLVDTDYQDTRGYRSPGFSVYFGLEFASL